MHKKIICLGIVLVMCLGLLFGCETTNSEEKPTGKFYTLQEAYDEGLLTVEDLQIIAMHYNDKTDPADNLSDATAKAVKETYRTSVIDMPNASLDGIVIRKYYGTYGDNVAIGITDDYHLYDYVFFEELAVEGVVFYKIHEASIRIWSITTSNK